MRGVHNLPASLLRIQTTTRTITTRIISHKNTKELVPWGGSYPAATHSRGGETPTLNLTSKWAPPAVRTRSFPRNLRSTGPPGSRGCSLMPGEDFGRGDFQPRHGIRRIGRVRDIHRGVSRVLHVQGSHRVAVPGGGGAPDADQWVHVFLCSPGCSAAARRIPGATGRWRWRGRASGTSSAASPW